MFPVYTSPDDVLRLWWAYGKLASDTHVVVTMRMLGLTGAWSVPKDENTAMIAEKAPAFTEAVVAGTLAAISGKGANSVMSAMVDPLQRKARSNRSRLARRGPKMFGVDAVFSKS